MYYVYKLIDPRSNKVFYIGKGKNRRAHEHVAMAKRNRISNKNKKLFNKIKSILADGFDDVQYEKILCTDEKDALQTEIKLITEYGIDSLCNIASGGVGGDCVTNHPNRGELYKHRNLPSWNKGKRGVYSSDTIRQISETKKRRFVEHPEERTNAGTFKSGAQHREFGTQQSSVRIQKRVNSNVKSGTYDRLKTTMLGNDHARTRSVKQLDLEGNLLNEYRSITEAAANIGIPRHRIYNVLQGLQQQTSGFKFERGA